MSRVIPRPTAAEIAEIRRALLTSKSAKLSDRDRSHLLGVLAWAEGKTARQVAADPELGLSDFTVLRAVRRYRAGGLAAFFHTQPKPRGRKPISADTLSAMVSELQAAIAAGTSLTYRVLQSKYGLSLGMIAKVAKREKLDAKHRRMSRIAAPLPHPPSGE